MALGLLALLAGAGVVFLNRTAKASVQERNLAQAQGRAVRAVEGLQAELQGQGVLAVLPGSTASTVALVASGHGGYPVTGIGGSTFTVAASAAPFSPGSQVFLLNGGGQGILLSVQGVRNLGGGLFEVTVPGARGGSAFPGPPGPWPTPPASTPWTPRGATCASS